MSDIARGGLAVLILLLGGLLMGLIVRAGQRRRRLVFSAIRARMPLRIGPATSEPRIAIDCKLGEVGHLYEPAA